MANTKYLRCGKCGLDATPQTVQNPSTGKPEREVGTSTLMRCTDCASPYVNLDKQYATMCRLCCPSNHKTMIYGGSPEPYFDAAEATHGNQR
jgi:hypothetical protein